jgi:hypothetical protein
MAKRAVIHIGIDKTGSTTIQSTLFSVRSKLLSEARILYPSIAANHSIYLSTIFRDKAHHLLSTIEPDATDESSVACIREKFRASMEADLTGPDWHTLVISAEDLSHFHKNPKAITRFVEWLTEHVSDITVVAYVRHPVDWVRSNAQERLKHGATFDRIYKRMNRPRWRKRFTPWLDAVGLERFRLVSFDDALKNGGIMASFCDAANLPYEKILSMNPTASGNKSISLEAALLLDSLNRQKPLWVNGKLSPKRRQYGPRYGIDALRSVPGNTFFLSTEYEVKARVDSQPDLEWLNATFGTALFPDIFEDAPPEATSHPSTMPQTTVDDLALKLPNLARIKNLQSELEQERQKATEERQLLQEELERARRPWWQRRNKG